MKSIAMSQPVQLTKEEKDQLTTEVKETIASGINKKTKFTAMDMWNRNRNIRSASAMMRRWNLN